ncbi:uncharacterized protein LOC116602264 [Nematostella vectensis]|uniref:uncharacterized protein LOC116602264 n=1 Tax=Nematostella vectensis TaxID=45351 RepID=UPI0020778149|nr:uncharacterized protein LOC116602264 [Nematostella vectensis]
MNKELEPLLGPTRFEGVLFTEITVEDVGRKVRVRNDPHSRTNHYIKQSKPYYPGRKLSTYLNFPGIKNITIMLWFCTFFGALAMLDECSPVLGWVPVCCFVVSAFGISLFAQHETVSWKTLRLVLKQPVFQDQKDANAFYRVTVNELTGVALQNYYNGYGCVQVQEGLIQFQAFNPEAVRSMFTARRFSRFMLFLYFLAGVYNFYFIMFYSLGLRF